MVKHTRQFSRSSSTSSKKNGAVAKTTSKKTQGSGLSTSNKKTNGTNRIAASNRTTSKKTNGARVSASNKKTNGTNTIAASNRTTKTNIKSSKTGMVNRQKIENLYELLIAELSSLYIAENMITDHLPAMANKASNPKLKDAIRQHLKETRAQSTRLKKIFTILGEKNSSMKCHGMEGLLKEGTESISNTIRAATQDACIIACAQKIEHYEISAYGTARAHAIQLKLQQVADLLKETLEEEIHADKMLTKIAEGSFFTDGINKQASEIEEIAGSK